MIAGGGDNLEEGKHKGVRPSIKSCPKNKEGASQNVETDQTPIQTPEGDLQKLFSEVAASTPAKKDGQTKSKTKDDTPTSVKNFLQTHIDKFGALKRRIGDRSPPSPSSNEVGSAKRPAKK